MNKIFGNYFSFRNDNILGKAYSINYSYDVEEEEIHVTPLMKLKRLGKTIGFVPLVLLFSAFAMFPKTRIIFYLFLLLVVLFSLRWLSKLFRRFLIRIRHLFWPERDYRPYEYELEQFIKNNGLDHFFPISYIETENQVLVQIKKDGGKYQSVAVGSDDKLSAVLNMELVSKKDNLNSVIYYFNKYPIQRKEISSIALTDNRKINIYSDLNLDISKVFSTLISGVTGSGKSYLTYFLLAKYCSQTFMRKIGSEVYEVRPKLYCLDGKRSDLYRHMRNSGISDNYYGSNVADAFRILREFTDLLVARQELSDTLDVYDKNLIELGYEPYLLVIDEYSSLVSMMSSKQKDEFEKMVGNVARLGRSLSMGCWVIMQQANSSFLSTDIREQLANKLFMGNPSQQSAQMMFGVSSSDLPKVEEIGAGIASIEGKEPVKFLGPTFNVDSNELLHPILKSLADNRKTIDDVENYYK